MTDRIEALEAENKELREKLNRVVREAFNEGFQEGRDGGWVWGDPSPAWKESFALKELKGQN